VPSSRSSSSWFSALPHPGDWIYTLHLRRNEDHAKLYKVHLHTKFPLILTNFLTQIPWLGRKKMLFCKYLLRKSKYDFVSSLSQFNILIYLHWRFFKRPLPRNQCSSSPHRMRPESSLQFQIKRRFFKWTLGVKFTPEGKFGPCVVLKTRPYVRPSNLLKSSVRSSLGANKGVNVLSLKSSPFRGQS
jgi:hypothetical protein